MTATQLQGSPAESANGHVLADVGSVLTFFWILIRTFLYIEKTLVSLSNTSGKHSDYGTYEGGMQVTEHDHQRQQLFCSSACRPMLTRCPLFQSLKMPSVSPEESNTLLEIADG